MTAQSEAARRLANESRVDRLVRALIRAQQRPRPIGPAACPPHEPFAGFEIEDEALLCARATILSPGRERLVVGRGSVIGAGAVLRESTGPGEIWAGVPARRVGHVA